MRSGKKKRALFAVLVFAGALTAGALAVSRLLAPPLPAPDTPGMYRPGELPGIPHEHVPGMTGIIAGARARINNLGFRGADFPARKPAGEVRIAVVGDSIVFGQGVGDDETLPAALERHLNGGPVRYRLINAGVRGYNSENYLAFLKARVMPLEPDLVVLVITLLNDPEREPFTPSSARLDELSRSRLRRVPLANLFVRAAYSREIQRLFLAHVSEIYEEDGRHFPGFVEDLAAIRDLLRSAGVPLVAVVFPVISEDQAFDKERDQLKGALDRLGIERVDPAASLSAYPAADLVVSGRDFHPNAFALEITARAVLPAVEKAVKRR